MKELSMEIFHNPNYKEMIENLNPSDYLVKKFYQEAKQKGFIKSYQDLLQ